MTWDVGATPAVLKRLARCRDRDILDAFGSLVGRLRTNPRPTAPDKRATWAKAWGDVPNHRHADLPQGWRACWTIRRMGAHEVVTILFVGSHEEYDQLYGFN